MFSVRYVHNGGAVEWINGLSRQAASNVAQSMSAMAPNAQVWLGMDVVETWFNPGCHSEGGSDE